MQHKLRQQPQAVLKKCITKRNKIGIQIYIIQYKGYSELYRTLQRLFKDIPYVTLGHSEICHDKIISHSNICQTCKNVISKISTRMHITYKIICDKYERHLEM